MTGLYIVTSDTAHYKGRSCISQVRIIMSRYISHSLLKRTSLISTRPLIQYRLITTSSPRMDADNPQTVRPPHKRVRGSNEHVDPENTAQPLSEAKGMNFKEGEIPEWLSKPPFSYGQSWEGWERKWRCSCWCGQSKCCCHHT